MGDKLDNDVNISINEQDESLKEVRTSLNTLEQAEAITSTDLIDGELICMIIISSKPININISIETYPEINIII